jgi:hypothetical protein
MKKVTTLTKAITPRNIKPLIVASLCLCALTAIFYMYAINMVVRNVVKLESTEKQIGLLTTEIGEMEFTHINQKNSITFEKATELGFAFAEPSRFISRKPSAVALAGGVLNTR